MSAAALRAQAGNTRFFGLLGNKSGPPFTNVEMSQRYLSLVTPAGWAFAIWAVIYIWELLSMGFLAAGAAGETAVPPAWPQLQYLWFGACAAQALWALLFAFDALLPALAAITALTGCLLKLAYDLGPAAAAMPNSSAYWCLVAPAWLHGGWVTAATLVNANLLFVEDRTSASVSDYPPQYYPLRTSQLGPTLFDLLFVKEQTDTSVTRHLFCSPASSVGVCFSPLLFVEDRTSASVNSPAAL